ncbi:MAG: hypothetical protein DDT19_02459 [Syntrophomonadaceae bacterium]|nr:hypothetical protein [Bacillota bacterium]
MSNLDPVKDAMEHEDEKARNAKMLSELKAEFYEQIMGSNSKFKEAVSTLWDTRGPLAAVLQYARVNQFDEADVGRITISMMRGFARAAALRLAEQEVFRHENNGGQNE